MTELEMTLTAPTLRIFGCSAIMLAVAASTACAAEPSAPVTLVATERLADSGYAETVLIAVPLTNGVHIGFILNRPTNVTLGALFPEHAPSRKVIDPVYFGGPMLPESLFALARRMPDRSDDTIELLPGVILAVNADTVDRVIGTMPNGARYFAGVVLWQPGELDDEIRDGAWEVRAADAATVFHANPTHLWEELHDTPRVTVRSVTAESSSPPRGIAM